MAGMTKKKKKMLASFLTVALQNLKVTDAFPPYTVKNSKYKIPSTILKMCL